MKTVNDKVSPTSKESLPVDYEFKCDNCKKVLELPIYRTQDNKKWNCKKCYTGIMGMTIRFKI